MMNMIKADDEKHKKKLKILETMILRNSNLPNVFLNEIWYILANVDFSYSI